MSTQKLLAALIVIVALPSVIHGKDDARIVKKAVERSTLNQPGTKPFHLKALLAPARNPERNANLNGEIEIWWASPTQFKREVRSSEFHQILLVDGAHEWQENEGDYFPEWLREIAVALIEPVPNLDGVLKQADTGELRHVMGVTHISWTAVSTDGNVQKGMGCGIDVHEQTGLLTYAGCLGWGGTFHENQTFHGRKVARAVGAGSPEVTATVGTLEDLGNVSPGFFQADASGGDSHPRQTLVVDEMSLRKNLEPMSSPAWPPLQDGPLEGAIATKIVVDRSGKVRDVGSILSDNPGLSEFTSKLIWAMHFKPFLQNDEAVQVVSRITMPFKTVRPTGTESFEGAHTYFESGRTVSFPAARQGQPYMLHANFQAKVKAGTVEEGEYVDTWQSASEWRREASIGKSRFVRAQHGEKRYELAEGPDVFILRLVFRSIEPIPALDTFIESDWRIKRDTANGIKTMRVLAGYETDGVLDPEHARTYWFDEADKLVKTYFMGLETRRSQFEDFRGVQIARQITVLNKAAVAMSIRVTQISPSELVQAKTFELHGHEHTRAFTDEIR